MIRTALPHFLTHQGPSHISTLMAMEFHAILLHHMESFTAALAVAT